MSARLHAINRARAARLETAMKAAGYEAVEDLLCDAMHLCDRQALDFLDRLDTAREHYRAETERDDLERDARRYFKETGALI